MLKTTTKILMAVSVLYGCGSDTRFVGHSSNGSGSDKEINDENFEGFENREVTGSTNDLKVKQIPEGGVKFIEEIDDHTLAKEKLEEITSSCTTSAITALPQQLFFEEPKEGCWGETGNVYSAFVGERIDAKFMAMYEQKRPLNLPPDAYLCQAKIQVANTGGVLSNSQRMYFDDEIYITFNNIILAASSDKHLASLEQKSGFLIWDWNNFKEQEYNTRVPSNLYCAGGVQGKCEIPKTQTWGDIQLNFSKEVIQSISSLTNSSLQAPYFSMITTGDNDQNDCKHSPFTMTIEYSYVIVK